MHVWRLLKRRTTNDSERGWRIWIREANGGQHRRRSFATERRRGQEFIHLQAKTFQTLSCDSNPVTNTHRHKQINTASKYIHPHTQAGRSFPGISLTPVKQGQRRGVYYELSWHSSQRARTHTNTHKYTQFWSEWWWSLDKAANIKNG